MAERDLNLKVNVDNADALKRVGEIRDVLTGGTPQTPGSGGLQADLKVNVRAPGAGAPPVVPASSMTPAAPFGPAPGTIEMTPEQTALVGRAFQAGGPAAVDVLMKQFAAAASVGAPAAVLTAPSAAPVAGTAGGPAQWIQGFRQPPSMAPPAPPSIPSEPPYSPFESSLLNASDSGSAFRRYAQQRQAQRQVEATPPEPAEAAPVVQPAGRGISALNAAIVGGRVAGMALGIGLQSGFLDIEQQRAEATEQREMPRAALDERARQQLFAQQINRFGVEAERANQDVAQRQFDINKEQQRGIQDAQLSLAELTHGHNVAIRDLTRSEQDYARERYNLAYDFQVQQRQFSRESFDTARDYSRFVEDSNKQRLRAEQDYATEVSHIQRDTQRAQEDIAREGQRLTEDAGRERNRLVEDTVRDTQRLTEDVGRESTRLVEDTQRSTQRLGEDVSRGRTRLGEDITRETGRLALTRADFEANVTDTRQQAGVSFARAQSQQGFAEVGAIGGLLRAAQSGDPFALIAAFGQARDLQFQRQELAFRAPNQGLLPQEARGIEAQRRGLTQRQEDITRGAVRGEEDISRIEARGGEDIARRQQRGEQDITRQQVRGTEDITRRAERGEQDITRQETRGQEDITRRAIRATEDLNERVRLAAQQFDRFLTDDQIARARAYADVQTRIGRIYEDVTVAAERNQRAEDALNIARTRAYENFNTQTEVANMQINRLNIGLDRLNADTMERTIVSTRNWQRSIDDVNRSEQAAMTSNEVDHRHYLQTLDDLYRQEREAQQNIDHQRRELALHSAEDVVTTLALARFLFGGIRGAASSGAAAGAAGAEAGAAGGAAAAGGIGIGGVAAGATGAALVGAGVNEILSHTPLGQPGAKIPDWVPGIGGTQVQAVSAAQWAQVLGTPEGRYLLFGGGAQTGAPPPSAAETHFATGGLIDRPTYLSDARTGQRYGMMAEAGPEVILPIRQAEDIARNRQRQYQDSQAQSSALNGSGTPIIINAPPMTTDQARQFADAIKDFVASYTIQHMTKAFS